MQRNFIFKGGYSSRWHTMDTHIKQDIAAHSFGVAWLCEIFTEGAASKNLIMAALAHDLAEHMVGDIPSPAKRALKISAMFDAFENTHLLSAGVAHYGDSLTAEEQAIMKFADMVEGLMFCLRERSFGNRSVEIVFGRFASYIQELLTSLPEPLAASQKIIETVDEIITEWKELTNDTSERSSSGGVSLLRSTSALGLGRSDSDALSSRAGYKILDPMEEEEWTAGLAKSKALS